MVESEGGGGGSCSSLSLTRTAPLLVGSACCTADKSVSGACVRACKFYKLSYVSVVFFLFATSGEKNDHKTTQFVSARNKYVNGMARVELNLTAVKSDI